jgi:hypothetical protein
VSQPICLGIPPWAHANVSRLATSVSDQTPVKMLKPEMVKFLAEFEFSSCPCTLVGPLAGTGYQTPANVFSKKNRVEEK